MMRDIAAEQRAMTIRMLIEGHADPVSAKRLGVSPRTYAGYVADLKGEYEAETRFQLGYAMGRQGVSGREGPDGEPAPGTDGGPEHPPGRQVRRMGTRAVTWSLPSCLLRRAGGWHWDRTLGGVAGPRLKLWGMKFVGVDQGTVTRQPGQPQLVSRRASAGAPRRPMVIATVATTMPTLLTILM